MSEFKDPDALAAILAASDPALANILAKRTKACQVEAAFEEWLSANTEPTERNEDDEWYEGREWGDDIDRMSYQSVAEDGKSVTLDGRFSVAALRELLRLIDEAWKE